MTNSNKPFWFSVSQLSSSRKAHPSTPNNNDKTNKDEAIGRLGTAGFLGLTAAAALAVGVSSTAGERSAETPLAQLPTKTQQRGTKLTASDAQQVKLIQERAKTDAVFRRLLQTDPSKALEQFSLSPDGRSRLLTNISNEKSGSAKLPNAGDAAWCVCTGCCVTTINQPGTDQVNPGLRRLQ